MAARILAVAQRKGGAGKTTVAAQLAIAWVARGYSVAMLDVDPQASLSSWAEARKATGVLGPPPVTALQGWRLATEIDRLKSAYELIIIDTPPHGETDARVAVRAANLVLVPIQPSPMDLWATGQTLELAKSEKSRALLVFNRLQPRSSLIDRIRAAVEAGKLPVTKASLGNRVAFASSMMEGRGVIESHPGSPAAQDIEALADEITPPLFGL